MVLKKEEFMAAIKARLGDDASDDALKFLEDMTDTFNHMEEATNNRDEWEEKYRQNDAEWRARYTARFFNPTAAGDVPTSAPQPSPGEPATREPEQAEPEPADVGFEDLFE